MLTYLLSDMFSCLPICINGICGARLSQRGLVPHQALGGVPVGGQHAVGAARRAADVEAGQLGDLAHEAGGRRAAGGRGRALRRRAHARRR